MLSINSPLVVLAVILISILLINVEDVTAGHLTRTPHNLSCYHCNSLTDGDSCRYLQLNNAPTQACKPNQMFCSVILFQYSTDSSEYLFYSVQRHCEETCQEGCSTVGERIKLFLCRSCCNGYLCNYGNIGTKTALPNNYYMFLIISVALCSHTGCLLVRKEANVSGKSRKSYENGKCVRKMSHMLQ